MTTVLLPGAVLALVLSGWFVRRKTVQVPCTLDLESTHDHLHAHVDLEGIEVEPGDAVLVHNAPARIPYGSSATLRSEATVQQASWPRRQWTKIIGVSEFYELYDVGFEG